MATSPTEKQLGNWAQRWQWAAGPKTKQKTQVPKSEDSVEYEGTVRQLSIWLKALDQTCSDTPQRRRPESEVKGEQFPLPAKSSRDTMYWWARTLTELSGAMKKISKQVLIRVLFFSPRSLYITGGGRQSV